MAEQFEGTVSIARTGGDDTIVLTGDTGNITLGGGGQDGDLLVNRADGTRIFHLDGQGGNLWLGGNGADGDIVLFPASAAHSTSTAEATILLNADAGDIILRNADCAEDFDAAVPDIEPGSVVVIDDNGRLIPSNRPYDPRVAGIISGAGCYQPGLVLDRHPGIDNRVPLAMVGKAVCLADAEAQPIQVGDLLTTSDKTGRAMVATDRDRAFGAVIGKALAPLSHGQGSIPVLIGLQ